MSPLRGFRLAILVVLALLVSSAQDASAQTQGEVSGAVLSRLEAEVRPLPFATVEAWAPGVHRAVVSDSLGRYELLGLPPGPVRIRVSHPGHAPSTVDVLVPASGPAFVDVELETRAVELTPVDVTTDVRVPNQNARLDPRGAGQIDATAIQMGAGVTEAGLADAARAVGGNDPGQAHDVLFMRGSTTDLKLVLLDGAPVYTPFHVAGLLRSFEPEVLGRADLHVGGAPARYDGGLTYILDLRTRRPRRDGPHFSGTLDLIAGSAALEAPLGARSGIVASGRSLHGLGEAPLGASPYGYRDVLVSLETEPVQGHLFRTTGFWNRESVVLDLPAALSLAASGATDEAWWSNRAGSAAWFGRAGGLLLEATFAGSEYRAVLPIQPRDTARAALLAEARTERVRAGAEVTRPASWGAVRIGLSAESVDAAYHAEAGPGNSAGARGSSTTVGGYVDVSRAIGSELVLRTGLRADHFSGDARPRLAPRAALSWQVSPQALLTVATGRYHQHARANDMTVERSLTETVGTDTLPAGLLPVASADHVVVSLEQSLGDEVRLGIDGFGKSYHGLGSSQAETVRSSGVDLRVQRRGERSTGWLGYGLSWFWSQTDLTGRSSDFTGRQLLTAGLSGAIGGAFGADVRVAYGAGLPYTSVPFRSSTASEAFSDQTVTSAEQTMPLPGGLDEDFLRLDVELNAVFRPEWSGRTWEIRPYLRVLNALDRRDALFYAFQRWRSDTVTPLAERPFVPVLGVAWRF